MPLLVKNGLVVNADSQRRADVFVEDETITRIEAAIDPAELPEGTEVIDATDRLVFPGFIDPHVHIHLPFMGTNAIDDHDSATRAALVGGTTTIIEMICPGPDDEPRAAFETWKGLAEDGANCDYSSRWRTGRSGSWSRSTGWRPSRSSSPTRGRWTSRIRI
ncbi:MAG: hypothetical protein ACYTDE_10245 [Planctomycetota bacterium]|jgi:dihydropyrimidinase